MSGQDLLERLHIENSPKKIESESKISKIEELSLSKEIPKLRNLSSVANFSIPVVSHEGQANFEKFQSPRGKSFELTPQCFFNYMQIQGFPGLARSLKVGHTIDFDIENIKQRCGIIVGTEGKEEIDGKNRIKFVLERLGQFRKMVVQDLFNLACRNKANELERNVKEFTQQHSMVIAGSTNLTSDYDVTVNGPYCSDIIELMFNKFYDMFGVTINDSFDTNLYPGSGAMLLEDGLDTERFNDENMGDEYMFVVPPRKKGKRFLLTMGNDKSKKHSYYWAFCKLSEGYAELLETSTGTVLDKFKVVEGQLIPQSLNDYFIKGKTMKSTLKSLFCDRLDSAMEESEQEDVVDTVAKNLPSANPDSKTDHGIVRARTRISFYNYSLQTSFGKELDKFYRPDGKDVTFPPPNVGSKNVSYKELHEFVDSVLGYSGLVNWLCSEGYYTNYAVYAIVVCLQLGYHGDDFHPDVWLVAAVENLADLIKHMLHALHGSSSDINSIKKTYIKFSKYQYRIHFCLMKYYNSINNDVKKDENETKFKRLQDAVDRRKDLDLGLATKKRIFAPDCMNAQDFTIEGVKDWLSQQAIVVMSVLNTHHSDVNIPKKGLFGEITPMLRVQSAAGKKTRRKRNISHVRRRRKKTSRKRKNKSVKK